MQKKIKNLERFLPSHKQTPITLFCRFSERKKSANYRAYVRMQLPVTLKPNSEPEPDIAVVRIDPNEYCDHHPTPEEDFLIIEVADTTLETDRKQKAPAYRPSSIEVELGS